MIITEIDISNFKCFRRLSLKLNRTNVLIGSNASGKSNFINIFRFLHDITRHGLDNAISMQGGLEYLRNLNIGASEDLEFKLNAEDNISWLMPNDKELFGAKATNIKYKFRLDFSKKRLGFKVAEDVLEKQYKIVRLEKNGRKVKEIEEIGIVTTSLKVVRGKIKYVANIEKGIPVDEDDLFPSIFRDFELRNKTLIIEKPILWYPPFQEQFSNISFFDFDPRLSKSPCPITGKADIAEDGSNIAIVLKNIISDNKKRRKFYNLIKDNLPFLNSFSTQRLADKSLIFRLKEIYANETYIPSSLVSDGTINIIALIIAFYFNDAPITFIEEPERNIHPHLISKVVEMMKDASQNKQIIVTTHNPEMVKHTDLENILLLSRNKDGFSEISHPLEKEEVKTFIENEIGIEELFVDDLLTV
ncbi:MAG: AAA family ATPase [Calditrichaeota bacterium]|nr:AAA family ATPase [Calditrichota bacterium]